jgi:hypothetical protein
MNFKDIFKKITDEELEEYDKKWQAAKEISIEHARAYESTLPLLIHDLLADYQQRKRTKELLKELKDKNIYGKY